jgi:pyridoxamine 5'-phosphate oxidase
MPQNPMSRFRRWMAEAARAGSELREAVALATADRRGRPSVRYVLLKAADDSGFVFYTNTESLKGRHLAANPYAALAVYWHATGKQIRAEGRVVAVSAAEADEYWAERPRASQIASAASRQSRPLARRRDLLGEVRLLERRYEGRAVPRPPRWSGYRLVADIIEFWIRAEPRLHHREQFVRSRGAWTRRLLQP